VAEIPNSQKDQLMQWIDEAMRDRLSAALGKTDSFFRPYAAAASSLCPLSQWLSTARMSLFRELAAKPRAIPFTRSSEIQVHTGTRGCG
jgi:hypothetical protein